MVKNSEFVPFGPFSAGSTLAAKHAWGHVLDREIKC